MPEYRPTPSYTSLFTKQVAKITKQTSTVILKNKENLTMRELN